jgi:hypothetical protein
MTALVLWLAIVIAILLVTLVLVLALMRTQREDALFEHDFDVENLLALRVKYNELDCKYKELRHHEAAQLINMREMVNKLDTLEAQAKMRSF